MRMRRPGQTNHDPIPALDPASGLLSRSWQAAAFLEGWYYKLVEASEQARYAVIPGIFLSEDPAEHHAFVQILDGLGADPRLSHPRMVVPQWEQRQCFLLGEPPILLGQKLDWQRCRDQVRPQRPASCLSFARDRKTQAPADQGHQRPS
jgi:hypothetical protein